MFESRHYICKLCGKPTEENYYRWKKKPQKNKNHCPDCLHMREVKKLDRKERARFEPYMNLI